MLLNADRLILSSNQKAVEDLELEKIVGQSSIRAIERDIYPKQITIYLRDYGRVHDSEF